MVFVSLLLGAAVAGPPPFREALEARVEALIAHPRVQVDAAWFGPGLNPGALLEFERRLRRPLPPALRAALAQTGDVQVIWRCLPPYQADTSRPMPGRRDSGPDLTNRPGHGAIELGVRHWMPTDEPRPLVIDGRPTEHGWLHLIDAGDYYHATALWLDPALPEARVVDLDDYHAHVEEASLSAEAFLDRLVADVGYFGDANDGRCADLEGELGLTPRGGPRKDPAPPATAPTAAPPPSGCACGGGLALALLPLGLGRRRRR